MANQPTVFLSSPHMSGQEEIFLKKTLETTGILHLGENLAAFENDLASYVQSGHAAAVSNGTAGLHLALVLLGIKAGDEVLCQSFTFSASANPIVYQGAKPVFVDSEADTYNISPEHLENAIKERLRLGKKPAAMIVVHLYGMPAKMNEIIQIANKYDIPVIEDAAEALGSSVNGKRCGSFGKLNVLSFNGNKIITTSGGGAILSDDEALIQKARFLATQARDPAPHYQHSHIGYNYRMSNVVAAIGRGQMPVLNDRIAARRANYERYKAYFDQINKKGFNIQLLPEPEGFFSNRWLTTLTIDPIENNGINRETIRLELDKDSIESRPLWKPMHLQPIFTSAPFYGDGTSENLFDQGLCLPSGSNLTDEEFERIVSSLNKILR